MHVKSQMKVQITWKTIAGPLLSLCIKSTTKAATLLKSTQSTFFHQNPISPLRFPASATINFFSFMKYFIISKIDTLLKNILIVTFSSLVI